MSDVDSPLPAGSNSYHRGLGQISPGVTRQDVKAKALPAMAVADNLPKCRRDMVLEVLGSFFFMLKMGLADHYPDPVLPVKSTFT